MTSVEMEADFLDRLYEATVEPNLWTDVLGQFADIMGGSEAQLSVQDEDTSNVRGLYVRTDPEAAQLYVEHYVKCNPLLKTTDLPLALRVLTDEQKLPRQDFVRTEFYNDFLRRFDSHSILWVRLALELPNTACMTVVRPSRRKPFCRADIAVAERLHPHLIRAYRLAMRISGLDQKNDVGEALLDRSIHGVFVVDMNGLVGHVNRAGEALIASGRGLYLSGGILRAASAEATRRLQALIAAACNPDVEHRGGSMVLGRPAHLPLFITVARIRSERFSLLGTRLSVLICVSDPEVTMAVPEQLLCDLFGLTPGEARIAVHLSAGRDLRETAKRLGVSYYTVRAHLARIFGKTNTTRQAQLVQLMARMIGPLSLREHE